MGSDTDHPAALVKGNLICTSKYTKLNFLPKNLIEQFSKMANVYFIFISIMQMVPIISITNGVPAQAFPLSVVIVLSMIKDIFEDYKRHKSDHQENCKKALVYDKQTNNFSERTWQQVKVGDIVKVNCDEFFPADMVLCQSSESKGLCYVETKNLDGETNLKHKVADKYLNKQMQRATNIFECLKGYLQCEVPNDQIYKFEGSYTLHNQKKKVSLSSENLLLRGSSLRNTEWAIGFVVYAGHQTKIMMNSANSKYKMSTIEKGTNRQIILIFFVQLLMCLFSSVFGAIWQNNLGDPAYLDFKDSWDT